MSGHIHGERKVRTVPPLVEPEITASSWSIYIYADERRRANYSKKSEFSAPWYPYRSLPQPELGAPTTWRRAWWIVVILGDDVPGGT